MNTTLLTRPPVPVRAEPPASGTSAPRQQDPGAGRSEPGEASPFTALSHPRHAQRVPLEFSGSGSEYFRIWIVNLLLTLLTLGFYRPWARVRRLRYFYTNTHVGGHSFDFHGRPGQMLRGMVLAGVLVGIYTAANESSSGMVVLAATLGAITLVPPMLRASLQFRLKHTSWRGLRFGFAGSAAEAYKVVGLPMLLLFLLPAALGLSLAFGVASTSGAPVAGGGLVMLAPVLLMLLLLMLALPYCHWRLMQYRQGNYRLGALGSELRLGAGRVYGLYLRTFALALLVPAIVGVMVAGAGVGPQGGPSLTDAEAWVLGLTLTAGLYLLYLYAVVGSYFKVGLQNLVWSRTGNRYLRFRSELSLPPYLMLELRNVLLVAVTLGLYWPWAAVARHRMRLEAVTLVSRVDLDELSQALQPGGGLAVADAAGDLLGLDLGV